MSPGTARATLLPLLVLGASAAAYGGASQEKDGFKDEVVSIEARGERRHENVEIVENTYRQIAWKSRPGSSPLVRTRDKVVSLKYGDEPSYFTRGLDAWRGGRWEEAEQEFRGSLSAVTAGRAREWVTRHAKVYIADCRRRIAMAAANPARFQEAADSFADAFEEDPESPMLDRILLGRAECLAGAGKYDDALRVCDQLMQVGRTDSIPLWQGAARMLRGRVLEDRGETAAAAREFADLAGFAGSAAASAERGSADARALEKMKVRALVNQGWALFAQAESTKSTNDVAAARAFFDRLATTVGDDVAGRAAGANGRGALLLLEGKAGEALDLFLQVEVTMFAVPEEVTRALWYKSKAYEALGNTRRRDEAVADLKEFYPWSEWATRAR